LTPCSLAGILPASEKRESAEIRREVLREHRVNERIRAREVRVIDENGAQLGVLPFAQALEQARQKGLDLIEVAPMANPPVCRLMDYGKYRYEQQKRDRQTRKKTRGGEMKLLRLRPLIDEHDLQVKVNTLKRLLSGGDKVKVNVLFRGHQLSHPELGHRVLVRLAEAMAEIASMERGPAMEGRMMSMVLAPKSS
jgi:translation initiation factor IF-3